MNDVNAGLTASKPFFQPNSLAKVLIANRGEIALRVIRTCKALGIQTVSVFTAEDASAPHVTAADETCELPGKESEGGGYLNQTALIEACLAYKCQAIVPGYGFLSENSSFAKRVEATPGIVFCGPSSETIENFGLKHKAIELAKAAKVPCVPGSQLLEDSNQAKVEARKIGYPIMLKSSSGGGGMGLSVVKNESELEAAFDTVTSRSQALFGDSSVFLEKFIENGRHIEVQIFGNGEGEVIHFGERECSIQRRNQKVIEESPSPFVAANPSLRKRLTDCAKQLGRLAKYSSAGTVEMLVDDSTSEFFFIELNSRLQVEHPITEMTYDVDLVALMMQQADCQLANGGRGIPSQELLSLEKDGPIGAAIECRLYAENPILNFSPSPGLLQYVSMKQGKGIRIDGWIATGTVVSPSYDPMLAKIITLSQDRNEAAKLMADVLETSKVQGSPTNLSFLAQIVKSQPYLEGKTLTSFLSNQELFTFRPNAIEVLSGGLNTTVQDLGRPAIGHGVPIGGPADLLSFKLANLLVGNEAGTEALEITLSGPELRFHCRSSIALTGASCSVTLDGKEIDNYSRIPVSAGSILKIGAIRGSGFRAYLAIKDGFPDIPRYLGSKATCTALSVSGYQGRKLLVGDTLTIKPSTHSSLFSLPASARLDQLFAKDDVWSLTCMRGPFDDDEFISKAGLEQLFEEEWTVSAQSSRTGIRLDGPSPIAWSRSDGGEGGSHPSNILEFGYPFKGINMNGDTPVILMNDGPDLGGLIVSHTLLSTEWRVGQIKPGSRIKFRPVSFETSLKLREEQDKYLDSVSRLIEGSSEAIPTLPSNTELGDWKQAENGLILLREKSDGSKMEIRAAGDSNILIEYGERTADVLIRCRIEQLVRELNKQRQPGIVALCPCLRSLTVRFDPKLLTQKDLVALIVDLDQSLPSVENVKIPTREFTLPVTFEDPSIQQAVDKYMSTVRNQAVYLPSNTEYVARANGITVDQVKEFALGPYLAVSVGFYAGTPILLPLSPLKRLVAQKYNPTRMHTPQGAFGLGGTMAAIYGVDGGGGYQLCFGRTLPGWRTFADLPHFDKPWLFRDFDTLRFKPVSQAEYECDLADFKAGTYKLDVKEIEFDVKSQADYESSIANEVKIFKQTQAKAVKDCQKEEDRLFREWRTSVEDKSRVEKANVVERSDWQNAPNAVAVEAPLSGSIWKLLVSVGDVVKKGSKVAILEAMKTEIEVNAPLEGAEELKIEAIVAKKGDSIKGGDLILLCVPA